VAVQGGGGAGLGHRRGVCVPCGRGLGEGRGAAGVQGGGEKRGACEQSEES